jgi:hypothetical protein
MPNDSEISTVRRDDPDKMGWQRRRMALIVTLIGLATFVTPFVATDSEILGRTRWSPLQVILALHAGALPILHSLSAGPVSISIDMFFGIGAVYFLLTLITVAIVLFPSARFVGSSAAIGGAVVWGDAKYRYFDFQDAIYGAPRAYASGHQVHAGTHCLILLGVFGLLVFIAATKQLE